MKCEDARVLASADLDGQLEVAEMRGLDAHLAECEDCSEWIASMADLVRRERVGRIGSSLPGPAAPPRAARNRAVRVALAWAGILLIVWHVPDVVTAGEELSVHLARHQAGFSVALGIGFVFVAWKPDRAYGVLPLVASFTMVLTVVALIDLANGTSSIAIESGHLVEIAGLVLMWILGAEMGPRRSARRNPGVGLSGSRRRSSD